MHIHVMFFILIIYMASAGPIIYLAIVVHGTIYGKYSMDDYTYKPQIAEIPPEFDYVNKITKNPRGSVGIYFYNPETGENKLYGSMLNDLSNLIAERQDNPIVGKELLNRMRDLQMVATDYELSKTYDVSKIFSQPELIHEKHQPLYSSIDTTTTNEYINKLYSKNLNSIMDTQMDIYVLFQKGGPLHKGEQLLETIYNSHHSRLRRSSMGVIQITLNDILYFLYTKGYKNVILIDFSCESCYDDKSQLLPTNTTHVRRARRSFKGTMGGRRRRSRRRRNRTHRRHRRHY